MRHVGPDRAHRDADIGRRERRRVVDAVAHHRHRSPRRPQRLDRRVLLIGQLRRVVLVHAHLAAPRAAPRRLRRRSASRCGARRRARSSSSASRACRPRPIRERHPSGDAAVDRRRRRAPLGRYSVRPAAATRARPSAARCRRPRRGRRPAPSTPSPGVARTPLRHRPAHAVVPRLRRRSRGPPDGWSAHSTAAAAASTSSRVNRRDRLDGGHVQLARRQACRSCRTPSARTAARRSSAAPPLISTPRLAAADTAATIDTGVEITSAHGHDTTSSTSAR